VWLTVNVALNLVFVTGDNWEVFIQLCVKTFSSVCGCEHHNSELEEFINNRLLLVTKLHEFVKNRLLLVTKRHTR